jgi:hypothetical protein
VRILVIDKNYGKEGDSLGPGAELLRKSGHDVVYTDRRPIAGTFFRTAVAPESRNEYDIVIAHPDLERGDMTDLHGLMEKYGRKSKLLICSGWCDEYAEDPVVIHEEPITTERFVSRDAYGVYYTWRSNADNFAEIIGIVLSDVPPAEPQETG